jgi:MFS family permease
MFSLLRNVEFRVLTVTQFLSIAGDQLARVALTVLVFDRTNSALQAAIAYALTFVPAAIGGPLLAGLADRRPRRSVMMTCDLIRAPLIGLIAIPSIPLPLAMVLLAAAGLFEAPFDAARGALLPDILLGDRYTVGYALGQIVIQAAQVGGYGIAGILLIALSPSVLLVADAASFFLSALLILRLLQWRPAAALDHDGQSDHRTAWWQHAFADVRTAVQVVLRSPRVRPLALLAWSASTFSISFEALGAPLARATASASWAVGILLASQPAGTVIGALCVARLPAKRRELGMTVLAVIALLPLVGALTKPPLLVLILLGLVSGVGMSFNVLASTAFVRRVPAQLRGRALGLVGTGLLVGQGLGVLLAGWLATAVDARTAVGWLGIAGTAAVLAVLFDNARSRRESIPSPE